MDISKATDLANVFADKNDADLLLICGGIESGLADQLATALHHRNPRRKNLYFFLTTEGGDPDAAFRIARAIQRHYECSTALINGWCKSAGTLVCIGAESLQMGSHGELGPLDVQLAKPDELGGRLSGLTIDSAFRSLQSAGFNLFESFLIDTIEKSGGRITTKTAAEIASGITTGLLSPIFAQFDPNKIGEDYRSTRIAEEYAVRLDLKAKNLKSGLGFEAAEMLVRGYPSHGFVIDQEEAEQLFRRVSGFDPEIKEIVDCLGDIVKIPRSEARNQRPVCLFLNDANAQKNGEENDPQKPEEQEIAKTPRRKRKKQVSPNEGEVAG